MESSNDQYQSRGLETRYLYRPESGSCTEKNERLLHSQRGGYDPPKRKSTSPFYPGWKTARRFDQQYNPMKITRIFSVDFPWFFLYCGININFSSLSYITEFIVKTTRCTLKIPKQNKTPLIDFFLVSTEMRLERPFIDEGIRAGFPSPAHDFAETSIDLNKELIKHPASTFYGRVNGDSMQDIGIDHGDLLIIDKSLQPADGKIAVCYIDGEFTIKKIKIEKDCCLLMPANNKYKPIKVTAENDFIVWGIVIHVIKSF